MMKHVHIVGLGIAGALCAHELLKRGVRVTVTDHNNPECSSRVAAGMITPITGKRLKPTWMGPELMPIAARVYKEIEQQSGVQVWTDWSLRRVFRSDDMYRWYHERANRGEFNHLHVQEISPGTFDGIEFPHGGFMHDGVATVDLGLVIDNVSKHIEHTTSPLQADATVWCTGYQAMHHELWSWLPIEPSKGEILDVQIPGLSLDHLLTNGTWILPLHKGKGAHMPTFRIGATHDWDDHDPLPTDAARKKLLSDVASMINKDIIVVGHRSAIRPSTQFKRPLVGRHPLQPHHAVFTGLGTKGALQGPWAAQQLADHLLLGTPLHPDIDCLRWWKKA